MAAAAAAVLLATCSGTDATAPIVPTRLAFSAPPGAATTGESMEPAVRVVVQDDRGTTVASATSEVTLTLASGPAGGTLSGTTTVHAVKGVASFTDLSIDKAGDGYAFAASAGGLTGATSASFTVNPPTPAKLAFVTSPGATTAGVAIAPATSVAIQDARGHTVPGATNAVTLALAGGASGATLAGTTTATAVDGVATFGDISIDKAGTGYTLAASATGLTGASSAAFTIDAPRLAFSAPPSAATAGVVIAPAIQVTIKDRVGNTMTGATNAVTLALAANAAGGTLAGTRTVNAVSGVATFGDLSIDKAGLGYTLAASATGLTSATSAPFRINAPTPAKLAFVVPPGTALAGVTITPAIQVAIEDVFGRTVTSATNAVTVALASNYVGGTLSGTTTVNAVGGVATFGNLRIDRVGAGYTLAATSSGLAGAASAAFTVTVSTAHTALRVRTATSGASIPDSFLLWVDCDSYTYACAYDSYIPVNGEVTVPVAPGTHYVQLDAADNCVVSGNALRVVAVTDTSEVAYVVTCTGLGSVRVTTTTGGTDPTPDDYSLCIDRTGTDCYWHAQARANDVVTIDHVPVGAHTVRLIGVGGNCVVSGGATRDVTVPADAAVGAAFDVSCTPTERIAFVSGGMITVAHIDSTAPHAIINGVAPAWSPDAARLAYGCGADICVINADGTGQVNLTAGGASDYHPTWSPDGQRIAFAASTAGATDLYVVAASGGGATRLTQDIGFLGNPAWSPDGTQIAFDCQVDAGNIDICAVRTDGTGFARLTSDPARDWGPAWKPDGSTIAFSTTRFGVDEIALVGAAGGSVTRIGGGLPGITPTWSPDGTQLGFVQLYYDLSLGPVQVVVVAHADGSDLHVVARGSQPAWKPHR